MPNSKREHQQDSPQIQGVPEWSLRKFAPIIMSLRDESYWLVQNLVQLEGCLQQGAAQLVEYPFLVVGNIVKHLWEMSMRTDSLALLPGTNFGTQADQGSGVYKIWYRVDENKPGLIQWGIWAHMSLRWGHYWQRNNNAHALRVNYTEFCQVVSLE